MRFVVDQCVPVEVARWLAAEGHQSWTAHDAGLEEAADHELIAYAHARSAVLITTNRDCAQLARRVRSAAVIWLSVREADALHAAHRALELLTEHPLPAGRVLRVGKTADPVVLRPLPLD